MPESRKLPTQEEVRQALSARTLGFAPLEITLVGGDNAVRTGKDGVLDVAWREYRGRFVYEYRSQVGPKAIQEAALMARRLSDATVRPLAIVPHLSEEGLTLLESLEVSGMDLCGNGLLLDPPRLWVRRTGAPSLFKRSVLGRNVYQGISSLVPRVFLVRPVFASPQEVWRECQKSLQNESLLRSGTISKGLKQLEEDLLIARSGSRETIRVTRPAELLERVRRSYVAPVVTRSVSGKLVGTTPAWERLRQLAEARGARLVATGRGSAVFHTAMAGPMRIQAYVTDLGPFEDPLVLTPTVAFPNVELHETQDERVYFDVRERGSERWSSPVQTYLELADGGPRERETANELRTTLLRALETNP